MDFHNYAVKKVIKILSENFVDSKKVNTFAA